MAGVLVDPESVIAFSVSCVRVISCDFVVRQLRSEKTSHEITRNNTNEVLRPCLAFGYSKQLSAATIHPKTNQGG